LLASSRRNAAGKHGACLRASEHGLPRIQARLGAPDENLRDHAMDDRNPPSMQGDCRDPVTMAGIGTGPDTARPASGPDPATHPEPTLGGNEFLPLVRDSPMPTARRHGDHLWVASPRRAVGPAGRGAGAHWRIAFAVRVDSPLEPSRCVISSGS